MKLRVRIAYDMRRCRWHQAIGGRLVQALPDRREAVYICRSVTDVPVYIGRSKTVSRRLKTHMQTQRKHWWPQVASIDIRFYCCRDGAISAERALVDHHKLPYQFTSQQIGQMSAESRRLRESRSTVRGPKYGRGPQITRCLRRLGQVGPREDLLDWLLRHRAGSPSLAHLAATLRDSTGTRITPSDIRQWFPELLVTAGVASSPEPAP